MKLGSVPGIVGLFEIFRIGEWGKKKQSAQFQMKVSTPITEAGDGSRLMAPLHGCGVSCQLPLFILSVWFPVSGVIDVINLFRRLLDATDAPQMLT